MKVVGYGDNVIDRYINRNVRYPGGNCINFAAYARRMEISAAYEASTTSVQYTIIAAVISAVLFLGAGFIV